MPFVQACLLSDEATSSRGSRGKMGWDIGLFAHIDCLIISSSAPVGEWREREKITRRSNSKRLELKNYCVKDCLNTNYFR